MPQTREQHLARESQSSDTDMVSSCVGHCSTWLSRLLIFKCHTIQVLSILDETDQKTFALVVCTQKNKKMAIGQKTHPLP